MRLFYVTLKQESGWWTNEKCEADGTCFFFLVDEVVPAIVEEGRDRLKKLYILRPVSPPSAQTIQRLGCFSQIRLA